MKINVFIIITPLFLFIPQRIHRIGRGSFNGVIADREKGDDKGYGSGNDKNVEINMCSIQKTLKPPIQGKPCDRPGNDIRQKNQFCKIL